jgi:hypothetical protein
MTPAADRPRIPPMADAFERKARRILNDILEQREVKRSGTVDFAQAMQIVAEVMRQGTASHPDNDWLRRQQEY